MPHRKCAEQVSIPPQITCCRIRGCTLGKHACHESAMSHPSITAQEVHLVDGDSFGGRCDVVSVEVDALCVLQSLWHWHGVLALHAHAVLCHDDLLWLVPDRAMQSTLVIHRRLPMPACTFANHSAWRMKKIVGSIRSSAICQNVCTSLAGLITAPPFPTTTCHNISLHGREHTTGRKAAESHVDASKTKVLCMTHKHTSPFAVQQRPTGQREHTCR